MKPGRLYEEFIHDTFARLFPDFTVTLNDHIIGLQSGIMRQIDVSMRANVAGADLFYIIQTKDHVRPADITILGEFSAVIRDVGASKGFLICAAGFAKTIRAYAARLGIELLIVEDINAERWMARIEIPVVFNIFKICFSADCAFDGTQELDEAYKAKELVLKPDEMIISADSGRTFFSQPDLIRNLFINSGAQIEKITGGGPLEICPDVSRWKIKIGSVTVPLKEYAVRLSSRRFTYLKMCIPDEYRVVKDHIRNASLPAKMRVSGLNFRWMKRGFRSNMTTCPSLRRRSGWK